MYHVHLTPDASSFCVQFNPSHTTRTQERPQGTEEIESEVCGNCSLAVAIWIIWLCLRHGVYPLSAETFVLEQAATERAWRLKRGIERQAEANLGAMRSVKPTLEDPQPVAT